MRWPVVGLAVALLACRPDPGASLAQRVYGATLDAWHGRNDLPPLIDRGQYCGQLDLFDMEAPPTVEHYNRLCPAKSWACLRWQVMAGKVRVVFAPMAIVHPKLPAARWAAHGVHELLHAFQRCRDNGQPPIEDDAHTDQRVWETGGPTSVERTAERSLYEPE